MVTIAFSYHELSQKNGRFKQFLAASNEAREVLLDTHSNLGKGSRFTGVFPESAIA